FFFFQAEDGIRVFHVTGVQTCALPISEKKAIEVDADALREYEGVYRIDADAARVLRVVDGKLTSQRTGGLAYPLIPVAKDTFVRSEERRVGKGGRWQRGRAAEERKSVR